MVAAYAENATLEAVSPTSRRDTESARLVPDRFAVQARRTPDALAVVGADLALTYGELDRRSNQIANFLRGCGVGAEVCVALCLNPSAAYILGALGILKSGGAYLTLDPAHPADRLARQLSDAEVSIVLTARQWEARLPDGPWQVLSLDGAWDDIARASMLPPVVGISRDHLACIVYTSGTTGQPQGVEITHRSLQNLVGWHQGEFVVAATDRATQLASVAFDAAAWAPWPYLTLGACITPTSGRAQAAPALLRDWLVRRGITVCFVPTPPAERLLALP
jgi:non-ribosomal peptide synthetase component F